MWGTRPSLQYWAKLNPAMLGFRWIREPEEGLEGLVFSSSTAIIHYQLHLAKLWVASSLLPLLRSQDGLSGMRARSRMGRIGMRAPGKVVSRQGRPQPRMYISRLPARKKHNVPFWLIGLENIKL